LTVFIVLVALFVIALMVNTNNERNKAARLHQLSLKSSEALAMASMYKMRLAAMSPEEAFIETLADEEREKYLSLTTVLERLSFTVDIAENRIKKQSNAIQQLNKSLNA
ncbi:hypothetical protein BS571_19260, partial [Acinetobacter baumannii]